MAAYPIVSMTLLINSGASGGMFPGNAISPTSTASNTSGTNLKPPNISNAIATAASGWKGAAPKRAGNTEVNEPSAIYNASNAQAIAPVQ